MSNINIIISTAKHLIKKHMKFTQTSIFLLAAPFMRTHKSDGVPQHGTPPAKKTHFEFRFIASPHTHDPIK